MSIHRAPAENTLRYPRGLVWLRRDLRMHDHAALYHALRTCQEVLVCFVLDRTILDELPRQDRRVEFILASLHDVQKDLEQLRQVNQAQAAIQLIVKHGFVLDELPKLAAACHVQAVFANRDYEQAAITRDNQMRGLLANLGISLHLFKDQVIFEAEELMTQQGKPFSVYTPYKNAWVKKVNEFYLRAYPVERYAERLMALPADVENHIPALQDIDFLPTNLSELKIPTGTSGAHELFADFMQRIDYYDSARDFPAVKGVSYLSVHLRFGTISIRQLASAAYQAMLMGNRGAEVWLQELVWRDFYMQIVANFPHVGGGLKGKSFKPEYDAIQWEKGKPARDLFAAWCEARTGYPLVDAAMLQLNQTGYMHNRLRMVTASFLVKDLGIDWRWGEAYFAEKLNDFDLAANNGGWQWAASTGCDAQPYFRIFNPITQSEKFDAQGKFIKRYLPQLEGLSDRDIHAPWLCDEIELEAAGVHLGSHAGANYPLPIVNHAQAREKTLARYKAVKTIAR